MEAIWGTILAVKMLIPTLTPTITKTHQLPFEIGSKQNALGGRSLTPHGNSVDW